jgi:hypothetical protein
MSFATDLDALLAKLQDRVDEAMGEARGELTEMVEGAEKELAEWRGRFSELFCESAPKSAGEPTSHTETSAEGPHDEHTG